MGMINLDGDTVVIGNVGAAMDMSYNKSGTAYASFSFAVNRWDFNAKKSTTTWFPCRAIGKIANSIDRDLKKGTRAILKLRYENEGPKEHFFRVIGYEQTIKENVIIDLGD